jgi:ribonuclease HI
MPTSMAGVAAVLRYANEWEDVGEKWPDTDTIGPDGWHYQLRATMAAAIEALIEARAGRAVRA